MSQFDILDEKARDIIQNRIQKGMIGPGSDTWGLPDEEEIISNDYPLIRYFSGILFPDKTIVPTQDKADLCDGNSEANPENDGEDEIASQDNNFDDSSLILKRKAPNVEEGEGYIVSKSNFFPTNIGLSIALPKSIEEIEVTFEFGVYSQLVKKQLDIRIPISESGFNSFFYDRIPYQLPFKDALVYENGLMYLNRELIGHKGGRGNERSGEYKKFDEFKKKTNLIDTEAINWVGHLEKLLGRVWKREQIRKTLIIPIIDNEKPQPLDFKTKFNKKARAGYTVKVYPSGINIYIKINL